MIDALAYGYHVLGDERYLAAAPQKLPDSFLRP